VELSKKLASLDETQFCFASHWLDFAYGRTTGQDDACAQAAINVAFQRSGYNVKQMLLALTQTDEFLYYRAAHEESIVMPKFRLNRRSVLRGAGSIAIALPWLEIMGNERSAHGAAAPAQRFIAVYTPGGSVIQPTNRWQPTGTETAPILSPILLPLEPVKSKILVVDGLDMTSAVGEQHQGGIIALLTGTTQNMPPANGGIPGMNSYSHGPSVDQVIATQQNAAKPRAKKSIEIAIRWATGKSHGLLSPINALNSRTARWPVPFHRASTRCRSSPICSET